MTVTTTTTGQISRVIGEVSNLISTGSDGGSPSIATGTGYEVPDGDTYVAFRGADIAKYLSLGLQQRDYGTILISIWAKIPTAITDDFYIWDASVSDTNAAYGGFALQVGSDETFRVRFRVPGGSPLTYIEAPIIENAYRRYYDSWGEGVWPFHKIVTDTVLGVAVTHSPHGDYVELYIDGTLRRVSAHGAALGEINPASGLVLWGSCEDPADQSMDNVMNAGAETTMGTKSLLIQRVDYDVNAKVSLIMAEHANNASGMPRTARELPGFL